MNKEVYQCITKCQTTTQTIKKAPELSLKICFHGGGGVLSQKLTFCAMKKNSYHQFTQHLSLAHSSRQLVRICLQDDRLPV